jgi:hypothetical protein
MENNQLQTVPEKNILSIDDIKDRLQATEALYNSIMKKDIDYGVIKRLGCL